MAGRPVHDPDGFFDPSALQYGGRGVLNDRNMACHEGVHVAAAPAAGQVGLVAGKNEAYAVRLKNMAVLLIQPS